MRSFTVILSALVLLTGSVSAAALPTTTPSLPLSAPNSTPTLPSAAEATGKADLALAQRQDNTIGDCNVTGQYCCDSTISHNSASASAITSLLSLPLSLLPSSDLDMGLGCSPLGSILSSGGSCTATSVCCKGHQQMNSGLIGVNCSPLSL